MAIKLQFEWFRYRGEDSVSKDLDIQIMEFMDDPSIQYVDIKYSSCALSNGCMRYSALLIYHKITPEVTEA